EKKLEQLRREYREIPIPQQLDEIVKEAVNPNTKHRNKRKGYVKWIASIAAVVVVTFTLGVNLSSTLANALSEVPVVGDIVKVITFRTYELDEENFQADIKVPAITNLDDKSLEDSLNEKYLEDGKSLYNDFIEEMEDIKESGAHLGVVSGYEVKTDNDRI